MIVRSLFGNVYLEKTRASTRRCWLRIRNSITQRQCVNQKHSLLLNSFCANTQLPHKTSRLGKYQFYTMHTQSFSPYYYTLYVRREESKILKVVPSNIQNLFSDPISLTVWYLYDGSKRTDCEACQLATTRFPRQEKIEECRRANFGLEAKIKAVCPNRAGDSIHSTGFPS